MNKYLDEPASVAAHPPQLPVVGGTKCHGVNNIVDTRISYTSIRAVHTTGRFVLANRGSKRRVVHGLGRPTG